MSLVLNELKLGSRMRQVIGGYGRHKLSLGGPEIMTEKITQRNDGSLPGHLGDQGDVTHLPELNPCLINPALSARGFSGLKQRRNMAGQPTCLSFFARQVGIWNVKVDLHSGALVMISYILQDWPANAGNSKGCFVLVFFRFCQWIRGRPFCLWVVGIPILALYVIVVHWFMGIELDYKTTVGPGLSLQHGMGLVVHQRVLIGAGCTLRHGVTIGERPPRTGVPVLEYHVDVGVNAVILGPIVIGAGSIIGAGAIVIHSVLPGSVVVGNPARVIRQIGSVEIERPCDQ